MDFSRFEDPGYKETLARFLADKYMRTEPDLIITVYPSALNFVLMNCDRAFQGVPVVACTIFDCDVRVLDKTHPRQRITGTFLK